MGRNTELFYPYEHVMCDNLTGELEILDFCVGHLSDNRQDK